MQGDETTQQGEADAYPPCTCSPALHLLQKYQEGSGLFSSSSGQSPVGFC